MQKQIAVIGLGRFGQLLCKELMALQVQVLAIDKKEQAVRHVSADVTEAIIADATDERVINELNLASYHCVIISFGDNTGACLLAAIGLKEAGVKNLWVKSNNELQTKILRKVGTDHIISPEKNIAKTLSRQMVSNLLFGSVDLGDDLTIYELKIYEHLAGKPLSHIKIPHTTYALAIKRKKELQPVTSQDIILDSGDILILGGSIEDLQQLLNKF